MTTSILDTSGLARLSDADLVARISETCLEGHKLTARLLVYLGEVEERRLDLRAACSSMFDFCVRRLEMSEGAAYRRITAARLVRRFPCLLAVIERGELHLSTLVLLRAHLNDTNVEEVVASVKGKTHREVEEQLARIAPRADVPSRIFALRSPPRGASASLPLVANDAGPSAPSPARIQPLSEARFAVQLTAGQALRDKLERARDLMRHRNPSGDLAVVVERALDELLVKLENERLATTRRPRVDAPVRATVKPGKVGRTKSPRAAAGRVARAVRRAVFERDGEQCTFLDHEGARCPSRALLELDHITSRALGGSDEPSNLRVRCRAHNRLHAEEVFGKEHVARHIDLRCRRSPSVERPADAPLDLAMRGLLHLGFASAEARRALDDVARRHQSDLSPPPIEQVLREAVTALT